MGCTMMNTVNLKELRQMINCPIYIKCNNLYEYYLNGLEAYTNHRYAEVIRIDAENGVPVFEVIE